jgi:hypothetical protein
VNDSEIAVGTGEWRSGTRLIPGVARASAHGIRPQHLTWRHRDVSFVRHFPFLPVIMQRRTCPASAGSRYTLHVEVVGSFLIKDEAAKPRPAEQTAAKLAEAQTATAKHSSQ